MNIEILQNTKGNPKIVCDGYMYNKSRTLKSGRISWRCERKGAKCTGAITTCSAMADPKVERPHNHDARPAAAEQFMFYDNGDGNSRIIIFGSRCHVTQ